MTEFVTTLNKIREHAPCIDGWKILLKSLNKTSADDEPLSFRTILESNGLDDALWCTRTAPEHAGEWRLYAVWCARRVQHLMTDARSLSALDIAEKHARGETTDRELIVARDAALAAILELAQGGYAAEEASRVTAGVPASAAAGVAAWGAAGAAAREAAWEGATAAVAAVPPVNAAWAPTWNAAWNKALKAAKAAQEAEFLRVITDSIN
jgi:hypothetical protein